MSAPRHRKHSIYTLVLFHGEKQVIVRMPDMFVRWPELRQRIFDFMKADLHVKVVDIFNFEGLAGYPKGQEHEDDPAFIERCEKAFAGSKEYLQKFTLYAWDDATRTFKLAREAVSQPESA
jgi:hypothetical protein